MKSVQEVCERVAELKSINEPMKNEQRRIRDLMDGGPAGIKALAGNASSRDIEYLDQLPTGNPLLSGLTHLSQKLQHVPDLRIPAPATNQSERAEKHAERRERIVRSLDETCALEMQMPQIGLWMPGYGFAAYVIRERYDTDYQPYPHAELRDPMESYPGNFGVDQQPDDIAFIRTIAPNKLAKMYPQHIKSLLGKRGPNGAVILGNSTPMNADTSSWATQSQGIEIAEYYDKDGCYWVVPGKRLLLEFVENPLNNRPAFHVGKRFSFNKLQGQYNHVIGLMAMSAKLTVMQAQFIQDSVHTETNVFGEMSGDYRKGRFAINQLNPQTRVEKPMNSMPFQVFQAIDRLDAALRTTARYPIMDDGRSPNSFVTGAGLEELGSTMSLEVREYRTVNRRMIEAKDSIQLEWMDRKYAGRKYVMVGEYKGEPYTEEFDPGKAIAGNYRTRRKYGFMAGWDDATQIVGGLQLTAGKIISRKVMRDNLDGLDEAGTVVEEQIRAEQAEEVALGTLNEMAAQGDPRAMSAAIEMMPQGAVRTALEKFFIPEEEAAEEPAQALPEQPPGLEQAMAMMGGEQQNSSLARLTAQGNVGGGVQTQRPF